LAEEFWLGWLRDRFEVRIGLVKLFGVLHRLAPPVVERLVRAGN
jgi:hypothetical protein